MMKFLKCILIITACVGLTAQAEIQTIIDAVEVKPLFLSVPANASSRLAFKKCEECNSLTPRLTSVTTFSLGGNAMKFAEFRQRLISVRRSGNGMVLISINTETNTVNSIEVTS